MSTATASQTKTETSKKPREYTLNAKHRCDRDGAQAYVRAILTSGLDLLFCRHHWLEYKPLMEGQGVLDTFDDETERLIQNRLQGSEN